MLARTVTHPLEGIAASFQLGPRWYAFYAKPQAELTAGHDIRMLGFEALVLFERKMRRRPGRKPVQVEAALFPRYGFVRFDINERWGAILDVDGVVDLIRCNGIPLAMPDSDIDRLKLAESMGLFDRTSTPKIGGSAEVMEGPFAGFIGKILRARTDDRVDLLLKILGAERVTTVSLSTLREA